MICEPFRVYSYLVVSPVSSSYICLYVLIPSALYPYVVVIYSPSYAETSCLPFQLSVYSPRKRGFPIVSYVIDSLPYFVSRSPQMLLRYILHYLHCHTHGYPGNYFG